MHAATCAHMSPNVCSGTRHILADHVENVLIRLAGIDELQLRNLQAFFEDVPYARIADSTADIGHVADNGSECHDLFLVKNRHRDIHIVDVPGAHPRVIRDHYVAGFQCVRRELAQEMFNGRR